MEGCCWAEIHALIYKSKRPPVEEQHNSITESEPEAELSSGSDPVEGKPSTGSVK